VVRPYTNTDLPLLGLHSEMLAHIDSRFDS
jgi:hypothetical protein